MCLASLQAKEGEQGKARRQGRCRDCSNRKGRAHRQPATVGCQKGVQARALMEEQDKERTPEILLIRLENLQSPPLVLFFLNEVMP